MTSAHGRCRADPRRGAGHRGRGGWHSFPAAPARSCRTVGGTLTKPAGRRSISGPRPRARPSRSGGTCIGGAASWRLAAARPPMPRWGPSPAVFWLSTPVGPPSSAPHKNAGHARHAPRAGVESRRQSMGPARVNARPLAAGSALTRPAARGRLFAQSVPRHEEDQPMAAPMNKTRHPGIFKGGLPLRGPLPGGRPPAQGIGPHPGGGSAAQGREDRPRPRRVQSRVPYPFRAYAEEWIERYHGNGRRGFTEDTRAEYRRDLERYAYPALRRPARPHRCRGSRRATWRTWIGWLCDEPRRAGGSPTAGPPDRRPRFVPVWRRRSARD